MNIESLTTLVRRGTHRSLVLKVGHLSFDLGVAINATNTICAMIVDQIVCVVFGVHLREAALLGVVTFVQRFMMIMRLLVVIEIRLLAFMIEVILTSRRRIVRKDGVFDCLSGNVM